MGDFDNIGDAISQATGATPPDDGELHVTVSGLPKQAQSYGTPAKLLDNVQQTESSGDARAVNAKTGAMGAYQFLPSTVAMLHKQGIKFDPFDAGQSRSAADQYIQQLLAQNGGDYAKAMAQYGGFKNADPSGYLGKVLNGVQVGQPAQPQQTQVYNPKQFIDADAITQAAMGGADSAATGAQADNTQATPAEAPKSALEQSGDRIVSGLKDYRSNLVSNALHDPMSVILGPSRGLLEAGANMVSGAGLSALGGLHGFYDIVTGKGVDVASQHIRDMQSHIYTPDSTEGKILAELPNAGMELVKAGTTPAGAYIGQALGGEQGRLVGEAIGNTLPDVAAALLGGRAALGSKLARTPISDILRKPEPVAPRVEPTMGETVAPQAGAANDAPQAGAANDAQLMRGVGAATTKWSEAAQAAGATPELVQNLKSMEAAGTPIDPVAAQRHITSQSLSTPVELTNGQASGDVNIISNEMNKRGSAPEVAERLAAQNPAIIQNFDDIRQRVAPDVSARGTDLDQMAVDAYKKMDAPVKADVSAKYKALADANDGDLPMSGKDFAAAADDALAKSNRTRFLPAEVKGVLDDVRESGNMTFNDYDNFSTILAEQARKAQRAGDGTAKYAIDLVRNALVNMPMSEDVAALKPLHDAATGAAKARFKTIEADPAYEAAIGDGISEGSPSPVADGFIKKYAINGKTASVQNMVKNLSNDPLNQQILGAGVIDHLKTQSGVDVRTNEGNVRGAQLSKTITNMDKKTGVLLGDTEASKLEDLGNVARWTQEQPKGTFVNNSNTLTGAIADVAKGAGANLLNQATLGTSNAIAGPIAESIARRDQANWVRETLKPGAGLTKLNKVRP